eukprot:3698699-Rhodomonas_salina.1
MCGTDRELGAVCCVVRGAGIAYDAADSAICLCACYEMPGTELPYGATSSRSATSQSVLSLQMYHSPPSPYALAVHSPELSSSYVMSSADLRHRHTHPLRHVRC